MTCIFGLAACTVYECCRYSPMGTYENNIINRARITPCTQKLNAPGMRYYKTYWKLTKKIQAIKGK